MEDKFYCYGCGEELQFENENEVGYIPLKAFDPNKPVLCKRCFRLQNYSENHVYVCNKSSGYANILSDTYSVKETEHYRVFYME